MSITPSHYKVIMGTIIRSDKLVWMFSYLSDHMSPCVTTLLIFIFYMGVGRCQVRGGGNPTCSGNLILRLFQLTGSWCANLPGSDIHIVISIHNIELKHDHKVLDSINGYFVFCYVMLNVFLF